MSDDIRSAVAASFDKVEGSTSAPAEAPPTPAPAEPSAPAPVVEAPATEAAPEPTATDAPVTPASAGDKPGQVAAPVPPESPPATPKAPEFKAPQSWKPAIREHWAKLPPEVQAEVVRREAEAERLARESSEHRKVAQAFQQTLQPYMGMIQAERQDPVQAVAGLLQTAAALRTAPPAHKAHLVAQIVHGYGIPIDMLDAALAGQAPAQQQGQPQALQHVDPEAIARQAEERVRQSFAQQARQHQMRQADSEIQSFISSGEAEFFDDVRPAMAVLLKAAAEAGIALTIKDAYAQAVSMSPDLKPVLQQRSEAAQRASQVAAAQRAKAAASSVKTAPAPVQAAAGPATIRSDIEAAIAKASGR